MAAAAPRNPTLARAYDWKASTGSRLRIFKIVFLLFGIAGTLILYWHWNAPPSPLHLSVEGNRLGHHLFTYATYKYLIDYKNKSDVWTARHEERDLRLAADEFNETGTLALSTLSATSQRQTILLEPAEWFSHHVNGAHSTHTPISLEDASLNPASVLMTHEGTVLTRRGTETARVGKSLAFVLPAWPAGLHRTGDQWKETADWNDEVSGWQIHWKATFHWTLLGYERCAASTCARLTYQAQLTPALLEVPGWARGQIASLSAEGAGSGVALFDMQLNQLISNSFSYHASLSVPFSNLGRIPAYKDQPSPHVRQPGAVVLQLNNSIAISKL